MKIKIFKFQFFAGVTIFSLFSGISVYAQSPNETDSLQTEEIGSVRKKCVSLQGSYLWSLKK